MVLVIVSSTYNGFYFSDEQMKQYFERTGKRVYDHEDFRFDPIMIDIVQHGAQSHLKVRNIPKAESADDVSIYEYDGKESAHFGTAKAIRRKLEAFNEESSTLHECKRFIKALKGFFNDEYTESCRIPSIDQSQVE